MSIEPLPSAGPSNSMAGWGANLKTAICENCDRRYLLPPDHWPPACPFCFRAPLEALTAADDFLEHGPELVVPLTVSKATVTANIRSFAGRIWFAPGDLTAQNLEARLQPIYLPVWLVDSQVRAVWQAEAGFDYEAVSYQDRYNKGEWVSQRMTETRIRWRPRLGRLNRRYDNIVAPALEEQAALHRRLGAYDLQAAQPYQAQGLARVLIRLPNRSPVDAWPEAVPGFKAEAAEECRRACRADHIREFRWQADYQDQHWTLMLLPLYSTYYLDDDRTPRPVLIHGQSGRLSGSRRASLKRARKYSFIIAGAAAAVFGAALIAALASLAVPLLLGAAALGLGLALLIGLAALVPVGLVWRFNRKNS